MKFHQVLSCVVLLALPVAALATSGPTSGTGIGTAGDKQPQPVNIETVTPGHAFNNGDVTVDNKADSNGNASVDPKKGTATSNTTVTMQSDTIADVSGLEAGDVVKVSTDSTITVSGDGGIVEMNGTQSTATVTNTAAVGSGNVITVKGPGGMKVFVPAQATVTVTTVTP